MHRLFVAIRPPAEVRQRLLAAMGGVAGARWQSDEQLHLTLRFIGEVDRRQAEDVAIALSGVRFPTVDIALGGVGTFERRGRAEVIWAGIVANEMLNALHNKVDQACVRAGLEPERRAYHPHITLARLGKSAGPVAGALDASLMLSGITFEAREFCLFESSLSAEGAVYRVVETYGLG